ncbi:MAG: hypothetical protein DRP56_08245 [Planctomycetota bacterium]|nr:MAG: hypothetical protein DRP56_08245 [Planctomycetota bacterium]
MDRILCAFVKRSYESIGFFVCQFGRWTIVFECIFGQNDCWIEEGLFDLIWADGCRCVDTAGFGLREQAALTLMGRRSDIFHLTNAFKNVYLSGL